MDERLSNASSDLFRKRKKLTMGLPSLHPTKGLGTRHEMRFRWKRVLLGCNPSPPPPLPETGRGEQEDEGIVRDRLRMGRGEEEMRFRWKRVLLGCNPSPPAPLPETGRGEQEDGGIARDRSRTGRGEQEDGVRVCDRLRMGRGEEEVGGVGLCCCLWPWLGLSSTCSKKGSR
jgi:hypothetical protein